MDERKRATELLQVLKAHLDLLAESERLRRPVLLFSACITYCRTIPWFEEAYLDVRRDETEFPNAAIRKLLAQAGPEWQKLTGLPPLADHVDDWHLAASLAGIGGAETLSDIESGEQEPMNRIARAIIAYAKNGAHTESNFLEVLIRKDQVLRNGKSRQLAGNELCFFRALLAAKDDGMSRQALFESVFSGGLAGENAFDQVKRSLNLKLKSLGLRVKSKTRGIWQLAEL